MAIIKQLKNKIYGLVYPITKTNAIYNEDNTKLSDTIITTDGIYDETDDVKLNADLLEGHNSDYYAKQSNMEFKDMISSKSDNCVGALGGYYNDYIAIVSGELTVAANKTLVNGSVICNIKKPRAMFYTTITTFTGVPVPILVDRNGTVSAYYPQRAITPNDGRIDFALTYVPLKE